MITYLLIKFFRSRKEKKQKEFDEFLSFLVLCLIKTKKMLFLFDEEIRTCDYAVDVFFKNNTEKKSHYEEEKKTLEGKIRLCRKAEQEIDHLLRTITIKNYLSAKQEFEDLHIDLNEKEKEKFDKLSDIDELIQKERSSISTNESMLKSNRAILRRITLNPNDPNNTFHITKKSCEKTIEQNLEDISSSEANIERLEKLSIELSTLEKRLKN